MIEWERPDLHNESVQRVRSIPSSSRGFAAERWPAVVVGAGAAGLLAALFAARGGTRVLLLETRPRPGAKIRVSGGGRCNILPSRVALEDFDTGGSRMALRNVLFSWPLDEVWRFFEQDLGIPLQVEQTGKVFPRSERPQEVVAALLRECARAGVKLVGGFRVASARRVDGGGTPGFELASDSGERVVCRRLVLATGGLSLPKTGSDGGGLEMAKSLGLAVRPTYPALVPLLAADPRWSELAGVSVRARLRATRGPAVLEEREGDLLFTHRGFSGPVVLDMSRHVTSPGARDVALQVDWGGSEAPDWDAALRQGSARNVVTLLRERLPRRLAELLMTIADVSHELRTSELRREERQRLAGCLEAFPLPVRGNEGYATAEVTGGGVPLEEVHVPTLESRAVAGLYLVGEMLDAVGRIGGYNFLWAWVTGRKAGLALAEARRADAAGAGP